MITAFNFFGFIYVKDKTDTALIAHEEKHTEQMDRDGYLVYYWNWWFDKDKRQAYEVEAYKAQIAAGAFLDKCAELLTKDYKLNITIDEAKQLLTEGGVQWR